MEKREYCGKPKNNLEECSDYFFREHFEITKYYPKISHVHANMDNWLSVVNSIETYFELRLTDQKRPATDQITFEDFAAFFDTPQIFRIMMFFSKVAEDDAPITAEDFGDERAVPENYTFKQYRKEKLPLLSSVWPTLQTQEGQEKMRDLATRIFRDKISQNEELSSSYPESPGGIIAPKENEVLEEVYNMLTAEE